MADLGHLIREAAGLAAASDTALQTGAVSSPPAAPGATPPLPGSRVVDLLTGQIGVVVSVTATRIVYTKPKLAAG